MAGDVWYVTYGSNLSAARLRCYLEGGRPAGGVRVYEGCRDPAEPRERAALEVPGRLYFAGTSLVWGGGSAFLDPFGDAVVAARAYRMTAEQFSDVVAQETRQRVGTDLPVAELTEGEAVEVEAVHYRRVLCLGRRSGVPMLTITSNGHPRSEWSAPSAAYLWTIGAGLRESHGWQPARIGAYLAAAGGVDGTWTAAQIAAVVTRPAP